MRDIMIASKIKIISGTLDSTIGLQIVIVKYKNNDIPLPFIVTKEGDVYVAWCPVLDIATQGNTRKELDEYIEDLLVCYFEDPDTKKPKLLNKCAFSSCIIEKKKQILSENNAKIKTTTC